ncbi:hypothetical protein [Kitasatospora sp. NPDC058218]|uniref:hypothetical protein n=1 Tax=Kitasatospora sp. NPDC058218 TaxID=3346385 RepID=UPI0036D7A771
MTSPDAEPTTVDAAETVQQVPAVIRVAQTPAAADTRDKLLAAIGAEAQFLAEKSPGQAATRLEALARAYAIVTASTAAAAASAAADAITPTARSTNQFWKVELWDHDQVGQDDFTGETIVNVDGYSR